MRLGGLPWGLGPCDLSHTVWRLGALGNLDMALAPRVQSGHSDCEACLSLACPTLEGGLLLRLFLQHV